MWILGSFTFICQRQICFLYLILFYLLKVDCLMDMWKRGRKIKEHFTPISKQNDFNLTLIIFPVKTWLITPDDNWNRSSINNFKNFYFSICNYAWTSQHRIFCNLDESVCLVNHYDFHASWVLFWKQINLIFC